jgi:pimeloyl-ACP methyl ester carboxylesterase/DNA-binding winged helix-turn-helix (wHTH) protein
MADGTPRVYLLGPFRLEAEERRLLRDGELVPLAGKAFDTLLLLVEGAGALQKQESLMGRLWPDVAVEQNNLQYNVSLVRRALADAPGIEIQTVRGQGYRLVADVHRVPVGANSPPASRPAPKGQRTHFARAHDGARLAYAFLGDGPPLVKAANWLSHVEMDWQGPIWTHWLELLSRGRCLIRYDARGNGLSDWEPPSITFQDFVTDLGTIFDAAGVKRAPLLGISQGAAVAVAYAARNPERVSALILIGGCARGWRVKQSARVHERFEALMALMRQGWGGTNAAFRQIFTTSFFPDAPKEHMAWFNELQRLTTSPDNAATILSALGDVDVRDDLPRIQVPTLVLHSRGDAVVPMKDGIELASGIPGARFVPLESVNHVWLPDEPAWGRFAQEIEQFLDEAHR